MATKLLISSNTREGLEKAINSYFYSKNYVVIENEDGSLILENLTLKLPKHLRVVKNNTKTKNKYRFEQIQP